MNKFYLPKLISHSRKSKITSSLKKYVIDNLSLEDAYGIQSKVTDDLSWNIGGWKLGGTNAFTRNALSCDELFFGPINYENIYSVESYEDIFLELENDNFIGEVEISFKLGKTIENKSVILDEKDLIKHIDSFSVSLECPMNYIESQGNMTLPLIVSDLCGSGYLIVGKEIPIENLDFLTDAEITVSQNGQIVSSGNTNVILGGPLSALFEFIKMTKEKNIILKKGQWIATGGCTQCIKLKLDCPIIIEFNSMDSIAFEVSRKIGSK